MEHKFQWSAFTSTSRTEQYVVRCDTIEELVVSIGLVKEAIRQLQEAESPGDQQPPADQQQQEIHMCPIHNRPMKPRKTKDGSHTWFDHRWQTDDGKWKLCNGQKITTQEPSKSASVS